MKFYYLNAAARSGKKKADGKPFAFTQVLVAAPLEEVNEENFQQHGHGFDTEAFDLDPKALPMFEGFELGQEIDLKFEPQPKNPRRNWVTGVKA